MKKSLMIIGMVLVCVVFLFPESVGAQPTSTGKSVMVRVENATGKDFKSVLVSFIGKEQRYGKIGAGKKSPYHVVDRAYRYDRIEVRLIGSTEKVVLQPIDFVGESLLGPGRYTYRLIQRGDSAKFRIDLELVVDRNGS